MPRDEIREPDSGIEPSTSPWEGASRWRLVTDAGPKTTWAPDADAARAKAERRGLVVTDVVPAPDPLTDR